MVQTQPMRQEEAIAALGALAQPTRLQLYRLLVVQGAGGMSAGNIAERLGVSLASISLPAFAYSFSLHSNGHQNAVS